MKRIAAYCRVSTGSEMQLSSLKNQRDFFEDFAVQNNYELVKIYADEGISGKQMKMRPQFLKLLSDSKNDLFDMVVTKDVSRFARNTLDFLCGIRELKKNGVDILFLSNNKTILGESEFILTIYAALAQQESENLSKRVSFGKKQSAKNGRTPNLIYGYDKTGTYSLNVNSHEAEVVRLIFDMYTNKYIGFQKIAENLNSLGILTKKNSLWTGKTISRILKNPIYCGILINNKTTTSDFLTSSRTNTECFYTHIRDEFAIISKNVFDKAQKITESRRKNKKYNGKSHHIFSSVIVCKICGHVFTKRGNYYRCSLNNSFGKEACQNSIAVCEADLLRFMTDYITGLIDFKMPIIQNKKESANKTLINAKQKAINLYADKIISKEELDRRIKTVESEILTIGDTQNRDFLYSNEFYIDFLDKIEVDEKANVSVFI